MYICYILAFFLVLVSCPQGGFPICTLFTLYHPLFFLITISEVNKMVEAWILTIFCLMVTIPMAISEEIQKRNNKPYFKRRVRNEYTRISYNLR